MAGLALIHQARGETSEAWKLVESISRFDLEQSGTEDERTRSLRARLMLMQGDLEGAGTLGGHFDRVHPLTWRFSGWKSRR